MQTPQKPKPINHSLPRVCIIGAGCSGMTAAKALHEAGFPFDCFEKSDRVGGNWVFGNKNGMSAAYRGLFINTSKRRMEYSDFPMPDDFPDFPHHSQIASYFESYVDHFQFRHRITFHCGVEKAERRSDGIWKITLETGEIRFYDALMVANGHHWDPRWPEPAFPGEFQGLQIHAHAYVDNEMFRDKNVVIVGMGNSAMDIAVESGEVARRTFLAARRGAFVLPKYLFGKPLDQLATNPLIPWKIRQLGLQLAHRLVVGKMENYGLPKPDHRLGDAHPTISGRILDRITHGVVTPKPNLKLLCGDSVEFADGSIEKADVIVYCTGYKVTFPFFDQDFISAPENDLPLFRRVFRPGIPNLFFIGLLQPLGAIMPLAETQSLWVADYLRGEYALPSVIEMEADMSVERKRMYARYVPSKRHTMQVDFDDYLYDLKRERNKGERRARKQGIRLPVSPQANSL
ncbi:MAG: NAD(P)-binding domain-containing protein [Blastocatellia bacterium]|nr:NAD(P)-binding domain-containing protein [Blastocatellia bacterium]